MKFAITRGHWVAASLAAWVVGCDGGASSTPTDAATAVDVRDAGSAVDVVDAGSAVDVGSVVDVVDAGSADDVGSAVDVVDAGSAVDVVDAATGNGETTATRTMVGNPTWEVTDAQIFSVPVGSGSFVTPLRFELMRLFGPQHVTAGNGLVLHEGTPHGGPYATELSARLATGGVDPGSRFRVSDWTAPLGLVFMFGLTPGASAPTGSSVDSASGPIIPVSAFPIQSSAELFYNGSIVDPDFNASLAAPTAVDGRSHTFVVMAENTSFIAGAPGEYRLLAHLRDATGDGWDVLMPFTVE